MIIHIWKYSLRESMIILFMGLFLCGNAMPEHLTIVGSGSPEDTLLIYKKNSDKMLMIFPGDQLKVKYDDNWLLGTYQSMTDSTLILLVNQKESEILLTQIEKIWLYGSLIRRVTGVPLMIVGVGSLALGGVSLVAGIMGAVATQLGAVVLVAVPPLALGGFGLFSLGKRLYSRKLDMNRQWCFDKKG